MLGTKLELNIRLVDWLIWILFHLTFLIVLGGFSYHFAGSFLLSTERSLEVVALLSHQMVWNFYDLLNGM